jgi:glycerol-3-phosphate acyltransferase PlsY
VLALTLDAVRNGALVTVAVAVGLALVLAWLVTTILSKVLAIAALAVLSLVVWTQREEVQECAERVRTTLTADAVDDTSCRFLGREVTVPGTLG